MSNEFFSRHVLRMPLLLGGIFCSHSISADTNYLNNNLEVFTQKQEYQKAQEEKKLVRSFFLPELSINGGLGSDKTNDKLNIEKGPYLFLDGKINLYRGGKDSRSLTKAQINIDKTILEKEKASIKTRIETFKLLSEINLLQRENEILINEIKENKNQQSMARKKVSAGLTTNVDLLDFDIKDQNLNNQIDINNLKLETINKEVSNLYLNKLSVAELENEFQFNLESALDNIKSSKALSDSNKIDSKIFKLNYEASLIDKKIINSEYMPTIDLEAKWGQITPNESLWKESKERQILLNINIPLYSGGSTGAKKSQAIIDSELKERELRQSELDTLTLFEIELKKIEITKKLLGSFELIHSKAKNYRELTISDYKRGIKNSPDVIAASDKYLETSSKILEITTELSNLVFSFNENFKSNQGDAK